MAIATLDALLAGMKPQVFFQKTSVRKAAGVLHSTLYDAGIPGAGIAPTGNGLGGAALTSYAGTLPFAAPGGGDLSYLSRLEYTASGVSSMLLCDRLWHNDSIVSATTTLQTINSATLPARDVNGNTDGVGVFAALEVSTATTNGASIANTIITYTNSAGTGSRTGTFSSNFPSSGFPSTSVIGTFVPFQLQAGDVGVKSIQSITLNTSYGTGVIHLVLYRPIAKVDCSITNGGGDKDFIKTGFPRLYDNSVLWPVMMYNTSPTTFYASYGMAQG